MPTAIHNLSSLDPPTSFPHNCQNKKKKRSAAHNHSTPNNAHLAQREHWLVITVSASSSLLPHMQHRVAPEPSHSWPQDLPRGTLGPDSRFSMLTSTAMEEKSPGHTQQVSQQVTESSFRRSGKIWTPGENMDTLKWSLYDFVCQSCVSLCGVSGVEGNH